MKQYKLLSVLAILALLAGACQGNATTAAPTTDPAMVLTAAAQTAAVRLTQMAALTPSASPTSTTPTPDLAMTAAAATVAAQLTATASAVTPSPSPTVITRTPTAQAVFERAEFVSDISVVDGSVFAPGAPIKKIWKIKNAGASTWTTQYALVFVQGDKMGAPDLVRLSKAVAPGETIEITVEMTAPAAPRSYKGYWKMLNPSGKFFDDAVYVDIVVSNSTGTPTLTPTPGSATPTPTSTSGALQITNATMLVATGTYSGTCPHTFTFTAKFTASQPTPVTYKLTAGSSTPGFTFTLPGETTFTAVAGVNTLVFDLDMTSSVAGWVALHITAPLDVTSTQANFNLTCAP